ncbi:topoisomerase 3alpha [Artemisia annua]|uniref:Topoisomerase 3alpha n=1 Tax=Artemisia annua TaxID=35608 RepID=A0A2U1L549_ARTAN|nr:topoisomerase 3alpha [Artemisia annua]
MNGVEGLKDGGVAEAVVVTRGVAVDVDVALWAVMLGSLYGLLGFVVERYWEIQAHEPEEFWKIQCSHTTDDGTANFNWMYTFLYL